jgi:hypothetical protein
MPVFVVFLKRILAWRRWNLETQKREILKKTSNPTI